MKLTAETQKNLLDKYEKALNIYQAWLEDLSEFATEDQKKARTQIETLQKELKQTPCEITVDLHELAESVRKAPRVKPKGDDEVKTSYPGVQELIEELQKLFLKPILSSVENKIDGVENKKTKIDNLPFIWNLVTGAGTIAGLVVIVVAVAGGISPAGAAVLAAVAGGILSSLSFMNIGRFDNKKDDLGWFYDACNNR